MALEFSERVRRIPVYPAAGAYALPEDVALLASNESPYPPIPAVVEAVSAVLGGLNRYPDPTNAKLRRRAERPLRGPGRAHRDRQRLVRHPARRRRGAARAGRRARLRVAVVQRLPAPGGGLGRHRDHRRPQRPRRARPRRHGARDHGRHAPGHRLQPQQPDVDRAARRRDRGLRRARAAPRLRDRRRGLLRVQHARRPRHDARPAQAPRQPRAAADLLEGLRAVRAARRLRAVRLGRLRHRGQPGPPALLLQRGGAGRGDRGAAPPGRGQLARRAHDRRPPRARGRPARPGHRARRVAGQLLLVRPPGAPTARSPPTSRPASCAGSASAACSCAPATPSGAPARCA